MSEDYMKLEQRYSELEASFECLMQERNNYRQSMHESENALAVYRKRVEALEGLEHGYLIMRQRLEINELKKELDVAADENLRLQRELLRWQELPPGPCRVKE